MIIDTQDFHPVGRVALLKQIGDQEGKRPLFVTEGHQDTYSSVICLIHVRPIPTLILHGIEYPNISSEIEQVQENNQKSYASRECHGLSS